ncbi:hypothetical protein D3C87_1827620 [compost metagenome]
MRVDAGGAGKAELETADFDIAGIGELDAVAEGAVIGGGGPGGDEGKGDGHWEMSLGRMFGSPPP